MDNKSKRVRKGTKPFTPDEDAKLLDVVKNMGVRKWGLIADRMNRNLPKE
eukprot:CAMPEP_0176351186 /NCGR_PEP_ID=MMETSP0126-20121128/10034_1 /TAXON_ID=141414 ORGANISM="Strombidinopsis acuminatum, Strain SPMC142" /NCGR_SAMPLE_ID=MMETSP0126 /ASSEMBLY_ACC=CAM_ASM_000229 /LENGTH=49 /DNA_ID=CAMNT_0017701567 /DNA_START=177 /DNA_END=326 /DNA_ORIENTATION=-